MAYFNHEYDLKIDLHYGTTEELVAIDWFIGDSKPIRLSAVNNTATRPTSITTVNVQIGSLTLYCILKYNGNVKAAISDWIKQRRYATNISDSLFELAKINRNHPAERDYKSPPPPITTNKLSEHVSQQSADEIKKLSNKVEQLTKQLHSLQQSVPRATIPQTQVTGSQTYNQIDGRPNQEYSKAGYTAFEQCSNNGYFNNSGIPVGYHAKHPLEPLNKSQDNLIYYQGETHLITIAPTGSGKLTSAQIPTLMEYQGSMVVIDPKGECAAISARQRKSLGHKVIIVNPFEILKEEFKTIGITTFHGFNPLATLNKDDDNFVADVSALTEALVFSNDISSSDPYWNDSAKDLISCLIMFVCTDPEEKKNKNLYRVRELLTKNMEDFTKLMVDITDNDSADSFKPMVQKAMRFTMEGNTSNPSIISTAMTHTLFIDDLKIARSLGGNLEQDKDSLRKYENFNFQQLKKEKITVYIILPAKFLLAYNRWFRLLITSALNDMMSTHENPKQPVLFMLDEFPVLGHLSCIETAVGLARGYGIKLWMFLQDLHQLKHLYKDKAESFLANTGMQQYFVPNDMTTAEKISRRMGNTTLEDEKITSAKSILGYSSLDTPIKIEVSHKERPLLYPIEIMALHKELQLVFFAGNANAVLMSKNFYYENACYKKDGVPLYDPNPYFIDSQ